MTSPVYQTLWKNVTLSPRVLWQDPNALVIAVLIVLPVLAGIVACVVVCNRRRRLKQYQGNHANLSGFFLKWNRIRCVRTPNVVGRAATHTQAGQRFSHPTGADNLVGWNWRFFPIYESMMQGKPQLDRKPVKNDVFFWVNSSRSTFMQVFNHRVNPDQELLHRSGSHVSWWFLRHNRLQLLHFIVFGRPNSNESIGPGSNE